MNPTEIPSGDSLSALAANVATLVRINLAADVAAALAELSSPSNGPAPLLDVDGVARALSVSTRTVEAFVASGELPVIRLGQGRGVRRFEAAAVEAFLRRRTRTVGASPQRAARKGAGR